MFRVALDARVSVALLTTSPVRVAELATLRVPADWTRRPPQAVSSPLSSVRVPPLSGRQRTPRRNPHESASCTSASDLGKEYAEAVRKEGRPDRHWEQFEPAFERFLKEAERYRGLRKEAVGPRP